MRLFEIYEAASNAKINKNKTKLVPLTNTAYKVELEEKSQFSKISEQETIRILRHEVNIGGTPKKDLWTMTIHKMKKSIEKLTN